jgi:hypothetical protein
VQIASYTEDPTVRAVLQWRADSATLYQLQPVLERLRLVPDQPCQWGMIPYACEREGRGMCPPCIIRDIRAALFGEEEIA